MKWLPAIVAALVLAAGVARADTLTPRAFTERVARATMAAMPSAKVAVNGDLQFVVRYANGASAASDLTKAFKSYEREPQHLDDIVQAQVSALLEAGGCQRAAEARPHPHRPCHQGAAMVRSDAASRP